MSGPLPTLKNTIRLYELIKVAMGVRFRGLPVVSVVRGGVVKPDRDYLLQ